MSLADTLKRMERLYSRKYGLADEYYSGTGGFNFIGDGTTLQLGNIIPIPTAMVRRSKIKELMQGGGVSLNPTKAKVKAFGEFIERYCSGRSNSHRLLVDSYNHLTIEGKQCLNFSDILHFQSHLYENPHFPLKQYTTQLPISWVRGLEITNDTETWIPAQKVYLKFPYAEGEHQHIWGLSTGLACGSTYYQAAFGGICEVIERDSFMLTWLLNIPGKRIQVDEIQNPDLQNLYTHICKHLTGEDTLHMYDISKTDGVYTFMAFIRNDLPQACGLITAAATHTNPEIALLKALEELCQSQVFAYSNLCKDKKKIQGMAEEDITDLHKHFFYYSTGLHNSNMDFIAKSDESVCLSQMVDYSKVTDVENVEYLTALFKQHNRPIYLADITKPEIQEHGFCVLKAIIPGYLDLDNHHGYRQLDNARLREFQKEYGGEITSTPHPFP